jgi:hypothetical protein
MATGPDQAPAPDPLSLDLILNRKTIVGRVDTNVTQDFIVITADKARLILRDAVDNMELSRAWQTPLGLLVTLLATLFTTSFQDVFRVPKERWESLFIGAALFSGVWLIRSLWRKTKSPNVEEIVGRLRPATPPQIGDAQSQRADEGVRPI